MKLHGLWVHNVSLNLYIINPGIPADSSLIAECFLRAMEDVSHIFTEKGRRLPDEVLIWAICSHSVTVSDLHPFIKI